MNARIAALFRHPIKGFTPEKLNHVRLAPGQAFPGDRLWAVEDGPSGFDPSDPKWIPKQRFTVLAKIAEVARARTAYDDATGVLSAQAQGRPSFQGRLDDEEARAGFETWLTDLLGDLANGPLKVVSGGGHRFLDHPLGHVSVINLASVRDLAGKLGRPLDPLRFRGNLYVDGWPAWAENDWEGRTVRLGEAETTVFKPIVRCAAPGVDPTTAVRDLDIPAELHRLYGHLHCGIYVQVQSAGAVAEGDAAVVG
jgi:uncharacterized protein YcbX